MGVGVAMMRVTKVRMYMLVRGFGGIAGCCRSVSLLMHPEIILRVQKKLRSTGSGLITQFDTSSP